MRTEAAGVRRLVVVVGSAAVLATGIVAARGTETGSDSGPRAGSGPLPAVIAGSPEATSAAPLPVGVAAVPPAARAAIEAASRHWAHRAVTKPGVPVFLDIPIPTSAHPNGVHARVTANDLNPDRTLYVPADPGTVSWARQDAQPGSAHGTTILTSHINYVINGQLVIGALSDLASYAQHAIGKRIRLRLADGRVLRYRIVAGREYSKDQLAADPTLRTDLYNQTNRYGPPHRPSGRLLLVSCGGAFDQYTGEYQDNVFLYLLPA